MPDIRALNSEIHRDLRVITRRGAEFGDNTHVVPVVADELRNLVLEYPVILVKDKESGQFMLCAMLGFEPGQNLYLDGEEWDAAYVPVHIRRQPFSLTYTAEKDGKPDPESLIVSIDVESKRVQKDEGERLFDDEGNPSDFLQDLNSILAGVGSSAASTTAFINTLDKHDLIEQANLDIQYPGGEKIRFEGLYSVADEKLSKLEGDLLTDLYRQGYLQAAWLMLSSVGNVRKLMLRKQKRDSLEPKG